MGTTCQNQPEVHAITQAIRAVTRMVAPAVAFKAEAIVAPRDLVQCLGIGPHACRVSDLAYHNSLMVQIWSMLAAKSAVLGREALTALPAAPSTGTWITYVRCHDDIGWAIRRPLPMPLPRESPDQGTGVSWLTGMQVTHLDPGQTAWFSRPTRNTGDRRISGTAASLSRLRDSSPPAAVDAALGRIFLAHAIAAAWGGVPVVWSGDELGQTNDPGWMAEKGHEADNRWAHRPLGPTWTRAAQRHDPRTVAGRVFGGLAHIARVRSRLPQLHASAPTTILPGTDDGVLATLRRHPSGLFGGFYNVTEHSRPVPVDVIQGLGFHPGRTRRSADRTCRAGCRAGQCLTPPHLVTLAASDLGAWWVIERPGARP